MSSPNYAVLHRWFRIEAVSDIFNHTGGIFLRFFNITATAYYADDIVYGLLLAVFFPFKERIEQGAGVEVQFVGGPGVDGTDHPDHVFVDGVDHQGVQIGACQRQEELCILVEEQEGVPDMLCVVELVNSDGTAAFLQVDLDDLVEIIVERVCLTWEIMIEGHTGYACLLYDIRDRDIIILLFLHQVYYGFPDALSGKPVSFGKFVPEDILHQWKVPFHVCSP